MTSFAFLPRIWRWNYFLNPRCCDVCCTLTGRIAFAFEHVLRAFLAPFEGILAPIVAEVLFDKGPLWPLAVFGPCMILTGICAGERVRVIGVFWYCMHARSTSFTSSAQAPCANSHVDGALETLNSVFF